MSRCRPTHGRADLALLKRGLRVLAIAQRGKHDLRAGCRRCEDRVESGVASGTGTRSPPGVARRKKCWSSLDLDLMACLPWLRAAGWLDRTRRSARGLPDLGADHACGDLRRGPAAAVPGQRAGHAGPSVTPTNLLYNVVSTPGVLYRYWRQGQTGGRLAVVLIAGTVPGVIAGSVIRVELLPGPRVFDLVVATILLPLGAWLA